jgi:uncharacterized membrane protein
MTEEYRNLSSSSYDSALEANRLGGLRTLTHILYGLYAAFWLTGGLSALVAIIINYVKRDDVVGTPYEAHFDWQIRTFWWSLVWGVSGFVLAFVMIGFLLLWLLFVWTLYRIIKGWLYLHDNKPLPNRRQRAF